MTLLDIDFPWVTSSSASNNVQAGKIVNNFGGNSDFSGRAILWPATMVPTSEVACPSTSESDLRGC
jgi:hypothetical protein